jgi:alkaline phosphatase
MIEGGAVDWKNHANEIGAMVKEQAAFNDAVAPVKHWVEKDSSWQQTLVIVTSDHECGMLWGPGTYTDSDCGRADKVSQVILMQVLTRLTAGCTLEDISKKSFRPISALSPPIKSSTYLRSLLIIVIIKIAWIFNI